MKLSLFEILQASSSDHNSPNILIPVSLSDLHQLVVDTIEATRERLLRLKPKTRCMDLRKSVKFAS